jgi:hypothetical protein
MKEIVGLTLEDDETIEVIQQSLVVTADPDGAGRGAMTPGETHESATDVQNPDMVAHVKEMIMSGYSDAEILAMHPEISADEIDEIRHSVQPD